MTTLLVTAGKILVEIIASKVLTGFCEAKAFSIPVPAAGDEGQGGSVSFNPLSAGNDGDPATQAFNHRLPRPDYLPLSSAAGRDR